MPGSRRCRRRRRVRLRQRNRQPRSDAGQPGRAELRGRAGQGRLPAARRTTIPARRRSSTARQTLAALAPLFADAGKKKLGQHGKYDLHVLRRHGIAVARLCRRHHARELRAQLRQQPPRHGFAWPSAISATTRSSTRTSPARAPSDPVLAGRARRRHALRRRGCRHHPAPASRAVAEARRRTGPGARLPRHRDAAGAGAGAHRGQRRDDRCRRTAPAVRRPGQAHAQRAAEGDRAGRAHLQPRFAQAAVRVAVRRTEAAGDGEDADRASLRPTKKRWRRSPTSTNCRA